MFSHLVPNYFLVIGYWVSVLTSKHEVQQWSKHIYKHNLAVGNFDVIHLEVVTIYNQVYSFNAVIRVRECF